MLSVSDASCMYDADTKPMANSPIERKIVVRLTLSLRYPTSGAVQTTKTLDMVRIPDTAVLGSLLMTLRKVGR